MDSMQIEQVIHLDCHVLHDFDDLHKAFVRDFGLPLWCGCNINALVDCFSSIREKEDNMCNIKLSSQGCVLIKVKGLSNWYRDLQKAFYHIIEHANHKCLMLKELPIFLICLYE